MSATFFTDGGFVITNAVTPTVIYMNQLPNSTVALDLTISPTVTNPTVPLKVTIQISGQIYEITPVLVANQTYRISGLIVPYLTVVRAFGNSFTWRVSGIQETNVLPAGMASIASANAVSESHPDRPLGATELVMQTNTRWGAVMDVFTGPITGTSVVPKRLTLSIDYPAGASRYTRLIMNEMPVIGPMSFRKIAIPPGASVRYIAYGNICAYFQWAWQRIDATPDL